MQARSYPLVHYLLLALAGAAWVVALGGVVYAEAFVSDAVGPLDVMSRRTATGVVLITAGWVVAAAAFALSLLRAAVAANARNTYLSTLVSGAYVLPSVAFLVYAELFPR